MSADDNSALYQQDAVRSPAKVLEGIRDFHSWLGDAVPGAMDIDFMVERRGHFLVAEGKPRQGDKVEVSMGQHIALRALAAQPNTTVYVVGYPSGRTTKFAVADVAELSKGDYRGSRGLGWYTDRRPWRLLSKEELRALVRAWWNDKD